MKPADFYIESKDLLGRLVPGLILTLTIYLLVSSKITFFSISDFYKNYTILFFVALTILSYAIGDINVYIGFNIRKYLYLNRLNKLPNVKEFLLQNDKSEKLVDFFKTHFSDKVLKQSYWELHYFCKISIADKLPNTFQEVNKFTATINYRISMIIPVLLVSILCMTNGKIILGLFLLLVPILLYHTSIKKTKAEAHLIFLGYYLLNQNYSSND